MNIAYRRGVDMNLCIYSFYMSNIFDYLVHLLYNLRSKFITITAIYEKYCMFFYHDCVSEAAILHNIEYCTVRDKFNDKYVILSA